MVFSSATVLASVASAAVTGVLLGVYLSHSNAPAPRPSKARRPCNVWTHVGHLFGGRRKRFKYPKRLIFVRHGQSEGNIDPLLYMTVPDNAMHLTALGFEQAVAAGQSMKNIIGDESVRFIVSPYVRTIETFQGITKAWGDEARSIPWTEEPRIREQDFGNFQEPLKIRECKAQRRRFGSFFYRFPSGESPADVYDRISSFLESLYRMFDKMSEENYVLVTHGVAIRVILTRYFKYRVSEFEQLENFHNGEFVVLEYNECKHRYELSKTVHNIVTMDDCGDVVDVQTEESPSLRVYEHQEVSYPASPRSTARRPSLAGTLPPLPPQPTSPIYSLPSSPCSTPEQLDLHRVPIAVHASKRDLFSE
ncbi:hypothetical protein Poli38472_012079 [Pythium oligandrum]|uniref:Phosphoglycerate mutase n=1 Tax=Pythium oligandrum TaxID=41045 RepID=A0A8K1CQ67_PYTOL|nr:hypothetical protein Poli38472_012079 [Pythium oligandrum]|eukprot:TMW66963.1 hypothetical protein Poli38472_012079 [Pythium oligandrum]